MGYPIQQSQTAQPLLFLMVLTSDHLTGATGKSPTVTISKNGAAFGAPAGAVSEIGNGWYQVAGNATDSGTLGPLALHATAALSDATDELYPVVSYNPQDPTRMGLTALPNAAAEAAGGLYTRGAGAGQINQPANGQIDANAVKLGGTTQTGRDVGASVLLSAGTGVGQLDFTSGVVKANLVQILATALTETAGQIAAAFKAFFNVAAPVLTTASVNQTGDAYARIGAAGAGLTALGDARVAHLDADVSSRLAPTVAGRTLDVAATGEAGLDFDNIHDATAGHTLTNITVPTATAVTNDVGITQAGADKVWSTTTRALTDKIGFALSAAGVQAIWDALTSALTTVGSIGKLLVDNINATISSRMAAGNVTVGAYAAGQDPATLVLATPANKLDTDATGRVNLGKWLGVVPAALSATGSYVQSILQRWITDDAAGTPTPLLSGRVNSRVATARGGIAQGGTADSITFDAGASAVDGFYADGCYVILTGGTGTLQARLITGYTGSTKVATVTPDWVVIPDATSVFEVVLAGRSSLGLFAGSAPNSLIAGRVDASVGDYPGNTPQSGDNYSRLGAPAGPSVSADVAAVNAKTTNLPVSPAATGDAMALTSGERDSVADALLDRANAVEVGLTLRQAQRLIAAASAGKVSGAGTTTIVIRNAVADSKPRITATVTADGNRTTVVTDGS